MKALTAAVKSATPETDPNVLSHAEDILSQALEQLAQQTDSLKQQPILLNELCTLIEPLFDSPSPEVEPGTEEKFPELGRRHPRECCRGRALSLPD